MDMDGSVQELNKRINNISNGLKRAEEILDERNAQRSQSKGDIRVDGTLNGSVETEGKVVLGKEGLIEGDVICVSADVSGTIKATITVSQLLSLKATARLDGDIVTNKLSIEPGATFTGSCSMGAVIKDIKNVGKAEKAEKTA